MMRGSTPFSGLRRSCLGLMALCLTAAVMMPAQAADDGVAQLKAFVQRVHSARGSFVQTVYAKSGRKPQASEGTFAFQRPGKFRWDYTKPYSQLLVGDGSRLWTYDRDLNQVTTRKIGDALGATPAAFLAGDADIEHNFQLSNVGKDDGVDWVDARPLRKDSAFDKIRLGLADGELRRMVLEDNFGQTTLLVFDRLEVNPSLDSGLFHFEPPKGADVISN